MRKSTLAAGILLPTIFLLMVLLTERVVSRRMNKFEAERMHYLKGATGEQAVARKLDELPEEFSVIHDLATPFGNLDHVVIGPTGVFVLETKNWKGTITADGKGGILQNGKSHLKDAIKPLIVRMMNVRKKIITLCDADNNFPYFNAVLVFPSARVEARWGQTGKVRCVSDEHIWNCIVDTRREDKLAPNEIDRLAQAFGALASMDKEFPGKANTLSSSLAAKAKHYVL